ncbi:MAG: leucyl aminopeptidase [Bacteroidetes bacterium]|nr:leucyl aminopeptidase [Bacteroidota bacterium]
MPPSIIQIQKIKPGENILFLTGDPSGIPFTFLSHEEKGFIIREKANPKKSFFFFNRLDHWIFIQLIKEERSEYHLWEGCRKAGNTFASILDEQKLEEIVLVDLDNRQKEILAFTEGLALGSYKFLKYKSDKGNETRLKKILICSEMLSNLEILHLTVLLEAVFHCRTLINEPNSYLTAEVFAHEVESLGRECGAKVEVFNKKKIESLQMGGVLAVNQGSEEPPTFTVMEWNPTGAINKKPFIFIGKGVVFDSGGMNLKPGDSMATMKEDMAGAACVATTIYAIAKAKLPVYVIGLMPATDNRPGTHAIVPGDIITMFNRMTVEVLNTDAEGRLILADALSYARKYNPRLVIDIATLTGSASRAIGRFGMVAMHSRAQKELDTLKNSGWNVYERLVEFPNWDEYGELIKSDLADLKNVGPSEGGAITAGKFLEKFTDYPYIHLDIAGPAFLEKPDSYRGKGATGVGVRLLFDFLKRKIKF